MNACNQLSDRSATHRNALRIHGVSVASVRPDSDADHAACALHTDFQAADGYGIRFSVFAVVAADIVGAGAFTDRYLTVAVFVDEPGSSPYQQPEWCGLCIRR